MPKITAASLFINGKCRFCSSLPGEKHGQFYHGIQDMLGLDNDLNLEFKS